MTAFASLSLLNNAAVAQTFAAQSLSGGIAKWMSQESVYDARRQVTMSVSLPKNGSSVARIKQKIMIPIMDSVVTDKKIAEAYIVVEAVLPKQASETVRLDLRKFADQLLVHAASTAAFQNLEDQY